MGVDRWLFSPAAYGKLFLHAYQHPSQAVTGLLLGKNASDGGRDELYVADVVPLFHTLVQLAPSLQVAVAHATALAAERGYLVVGYYHAPQFNTERPTVPPFAEKALKMIADAAKERQPLCAVVVLNNKMHDSAKEVPLKFFDSGNLKEGRTAESGCFRVGHLAEGRFPTPIADYRLISERINDVISNGGSETRVVSFEDHLNNPAADYTNPLLSEKLTEAIAPRD